jgi:ribonuclease D
MSSYTYIDSDAALATFCASVENCAYCALDTEFVREKTYYPVLALIQIATETSQACIDPQKVRDYAPLVGLFNNESMLKILHSPSQDLELFQQSFNALPAPLFDTQVAAAVLGYANQIGYADLVNKVCGVQLDKKYTRTDWSRRPLSDGELDYAMDDVRYLIEIYQTLKGQLEQQGRLAWVEADFEAMIDPAVYQVDFSSLWKRLKGVQKLKGLALNHADQLCRWREQRAIDKNRPRRWMMKDEDIVDIARLMPKDIKGLTQIGQLSADYMSKVGPEILAVLSQSAQMNPSEFPRHDDFVRLDNQQQALADCLMAVSRVVCEQNNIAMSSVVSKKDIDGLISGKRDHKIMQGWRHEMLGRSLIDFVEGRRLLQSTGTGIHLLENDL